MSVLSASTSLLASHRHRFAPSDGQGYDLGSANHNPCCWEFAGVVLCIHIQTHTAPEQVQRLVRLLTDTARSVVVRVSHDRTGPPLDHACLASLGDVTVVEADAGYGAWGNLQRWLDCVDDLEAQDVAWDWITNITGQDFPLRPVAAIEDDLDASDADGYVEHFDVLSAASPWGKRRGMDRYWYRYRRLRPIAPATARWLRPLQAADAVQPFVRIDVNRGAFAVGRRVRTPFDGAFRCYGGSTFVTLARDAALAVREAARPGHVLAEHFRHSLTPTEAFFHTVLCNDPDRTIVDDHRRYEDFGRGTQHARTLDRRDVGPALASGKDFARKWDGSRDPDALDELEAAVRGAARG
jgi:hypothetical protein